MEAGGWLWLIIDVFAVVVLGAALVYATMQWRHRRKSRTDREAQDETVRENYRQEDKT